MLILSGARIEETCFAIASGIDQENGNTEMHDFLNRKMAERVQLLGD